MVRATKWQRVIAGIAFAATVIIAMNIETLASEFGLDKLFISIVQKGPSWASSLMAALTSDAAFYVACGVIVYAAGIWTEWARQKFMEWLLRTPYVDVGKLADECKRVATVLRTAAPIYDLDKRYDLRISFDLNSVDLEFFKIGLPTASDPTNSEEARETATYLDLAASVLKTKTIDDARIILRQHRKQNREDDSGPA